MLGSIYDIENYYTNTFVNKMYNNKVYEIIDYILFLKNKITDVYQINIIDHSGR